MVSINLHISANVNSVLKICWLDQNKSTSYFWKETKTRISFIPYESVTFFLTFGNKFELVCMLFALPEIH